LLGGVLRRLTISALPSFPCTTSHLPCTPATPSLTMVCRTYMKNFTERNNGHRPRVAWHGKNLHHMQNKLPYHVRMYLPRLSEVKQRRKYGYEQRMETEGGRRILLRKILRGKDVLGGQG